jgi:hypothetical protein
MDPRQQELFDNQENRQAEIAAQLAAFESALSTLVEQWEKETTELLDRLPSAAGASRLAELVYLETQIAGQLSRLGYEDLARRFTNAYSQSEKAADKQLATLGVDFERLAPLDQDALATLRQIDFLRFVRAGANVSATLAEGIVLNALGGLSRAKLIERLQAQLGEFRGLAVTYADTGLVSYDRRVHWDKLSQVVEHFQYTGPLDIKTRPFCIKHWNKVYTQPEIAKLDNGTVLEPVWLYGGGFNCRHVFTPWLGTIPDANAS